MSNGYYLQGVLHNKKEKDYSKEVVANETHGHPIEHLFILQIKCVSVWKKNVSRKDLELPTRAIDWRSTTLLSNTKYKIQNYTCAALKDQLK